MRQTLLALQTFFVVLAGHAQTDWDASGFPQDGPNGPKGTIVEHEGYVSKMSDEYHVPIWVYHHINKSLVDGQPARQRPSGYPKDPNYPALPATAYEGSGYDHGHLAPAADFKWSAEAYRASHYMTNMAPQVPEMNRRGWRKLEDWVRKEAIKRPKADFWIVTGPVLKEFDWVLHLTGGQQVYVPKYFFKAIYMEEAGKDECIAFIMSNRPENNKVDSYLVPVDSLEAVIGLNLFPQMEEGLETFTESHIGPVFGSFASNSSITAGIGEALVKSAVSAAVGDGPLSIWEGLPVLLRMVCKPGERHDEVTTDYDNQVHHPCMEPHLGLFLSEWPWMLGGLVVLVFLVLLIRIHFYREPHGQAALTALIDRYEKQAWHYRSAAGLLLLVSVAFVVLGCVTLTYLVQQLSDGGQAMHCYPWDTLIVVSSSFFIGIAIVALMQMKELARRSSRASEHAQEMRFLNWLLERRGNADPASPTEEQDSSGPAPSKPPALDPLRIEEALKIYNTWKGMRQRE